MIPRARLIASHYLKQGSVEHDGLLDDARHEQVFVELRREVVDVANEDDDARLDLVQTVGRHHRQLVLHRAQKKKSGTKNKQKQIKQIDKLKKKQKNK